MNTHVRILALVVVLAVAAIVPSLPRGGPPGRSPAPARPAPGASRVAAALLFGRPLDLNTAGRDELEALPGIGPARAQAILDERVARGGFASVEELDDVPGVGPATLARLRRLVTVGDDPQLHPL